MRTIESLIPGSPAWLQSRSASKAPAVMGVSKYQTRNDLLKQMATGLKEDVDANTQRLFDAGHASEASAREIAEDILCDGLSPVCGESDDGYLTASFDGLTFDGKIGFEHKLHREDLAAAVRAGELPEGYKIQMDQQILVGGLDYVLFMCSDGTREKCVSMEYRSTPERAAKLLAAWRQFDEDLANYKPVEILPAAVAAPQMALPALTVNVTGAIAVADNLSIFGDALTAYIDRQNRKPKTDQEFADLDAAAKLLRETQVKIAAVKDMGLGQVTSVDTMCKLADKLEEVARVAAVAFENIVKAEKVNRKTAIVSDASKALADHIAGLNTRLGKPFMPAAHGDFSGAIKGLKTITSIQNACDSELARCKIEANEIADRIDANLKTIDAAGHAHLFTDFAQLVMKAPDDLSALIRIRFDDEATRIETERQKIRAEEEAKATAKAKAEQEDAERQRIEKEREAPTPKVTDTFVIHGSEPVARTAPGPSSVRLDETPVAAAPAQKGITGSARLMDRLDDLARQMTERELSDLCIHAAHILENRKQAA